MKETSYMQCFLEYTEYQNDPTQSIFYFRQGYSVERGIWFEIIKYESGLKEYWGVQNAFEMTAIICLSINI